jgi:hypothetical protein
MPLRPTYKPALPAPEAKGRIRPAARHSPENGPTAADLEKTAISSAVKQALDLTLKKHPL